MEKIKSLIDDVKNLIKDFKDEKKYKFTFDKIVNRQVNFITSFRLSESIAYVVKKLNRSFEGFINSNELKYKFSSKMYELKTIKIEIEKFLEEYLQVLENNKLNFRENEDANKNKKFLNFYKRLNTDIVDKFISISVLFKDLVDNLKNYGNGLKKNKEIYESLGKDCPKGEEPSQKKIDEFVNKLYKTYRNVEILEISVEDTLREINNTCNEWKENDYQFNNRIKKINLLKNDFPNINIDNLQEINDKIIKIMNKFDKFKIVIKNEDVEMYREKMVLDILLIIDTTSTMNNYLKELQNNLKSIIESIKDNYPLVLVKTGFIGYKDFEDLKLGDDYIDIDFLINYNQLINKIEDLETDGSESLAKDVAGAFKLALKKSWGEGQKLAILITNSPCHGKEYGYKDDKITDEYDDPDNKDLKREKIKNYLKKFMDQNIYLVCYEISNNTMVMYNEFQKFYEEKNKQYLFSRERNGLKNIIYNKVKDLLKDQNTLVTNYR